MGYPSGWALAHPAYKGYVCFSLNRGLPFSNGYANFLLFNGENRKVTLFSLNHFLANQTCGKVIFSLSFHDFLSVFC